MIDFIMRCRRQLTPHTRVLQTHQPRGYGIFIVSSKNAQPIVSLKAQDQQRSLYNKKLLPRPGKYCTITRKKEGYRSMNHVTHNAIVNIILGIADGKYREVILDIGDGVDMEGGE